VVRPSRLNERPVVQPILHVSNYPWKMCASELVKAQRHHVLRLSMLRYNHGDSKPLWPKRLESTDPLSKLFKALLYVNDGGIVNPFLKRFKEERLNEREHALPRK